MGRTEYNGKQCFQHGSLLGVSLFILFGGNIIDS